MHTNAMNYSVEDDLDIDFFEALKKMQQPLTSHDPHVKGNDNDNDNVCLITDEPLTAFHVRLECGHKFNYEPLYQEALRQKGRMGMHNYYEKIGTHQIKCPYCRSMTNQLLPYIGNSPHPVIKRLIGVNAPAHMCLPGAPCSAANKCQANAFYECNEKLYCHRHYQVAIKPPVVKAKAVKAVKTVNVRCIAENQSGKNKGTQCRLNATTGSTMCKMHAKCNVVVVMV